MAVGYQDLQPALVRQLMAHMDPFHTPSLADTWSAQGEEGEAFHNPSHGLCETQI
jgi:hypothetical protein